MNKLAASTTHTHWALSAIYKDFELMSGFALQRKKELEELLVLFTERVEAERVYA